MENKEYEKRLNEFGEQEREKAKELAEFVSKAYRATIGHYLNNFFLGLNGSIQCYSQGGCTKEELLEDILKMAKGIERATRISKKMSSQKFEDVKTEQYMEGINSQMINMDDIIKGAKE